MSVQQTSPVAGTAAGLTPDQPSERPLASPSAANDSTDAVSKRWAQRFQSAAALNSLNLGVSKSASVHDFSLHAAQCEQIKISLHLSVSVQNTNFGDRVILSGNHEALGNWIIDKSPSMSTSAEAFPVWSIDMCMVLQRRLMPLEFKFAIVRRGSGFVVSLYTIFSRYVIFMQPEVPAGLGKQHSQPCIVGILRHGFNHQHHFQRDIADLGQTNETIYSRFSLCEM
jgi:hypothetical protein